MHVKTTVLISCCVATQFKYSFCSVRGQYFSKLYEKETTTSVLNAMFHSRGMGRKISVASLSYIGQKRIDSANRIKGRK